MKIRAYILIMFLFYSEIFVGMMKISENIEICSGQTERNAYSERKSEPIANTCHKCYDSCFQNGFHLIVQYDANKSCFSENYKITENPNDSRFSKGSQRNTICQAVPQNVYPCVDCSRHC